MYLDYFITTICLRMEGGGGVASLLPGKYAHMHAEQGEQQTAIAVMPEKAIKAMTASP